MVRALLSSEIGTRAAEGNIGRVNRWFAGTQHIDEVEALCVELLKVAFRCNYADHRLMGSMLGNMAVYHAFTQPGDTIMSVAQPFGGHSSNRVDGPAGMRGLWAEVKIPRFRRAFTLSRELDAARIEAGVKDGVLTLRIPKQAHAQPRRITVSTG